MMASKGCLVLQTADGWSATTTELNAHEVWGEGSPADLAKRVADFVAKHRLPPNRILLAVRSQAVLAAGFAAPAADHHDRPTLCYQLESRLPLAAEDFVADFLRAGEHVLGICIDVKTWLPVISELEQRGLRVQSISPAALLALQSLFKQRDGDGYDIVMWQDAGAIELWRRDGERIKGWQHLEPDSRVVARQLAVETLTAGRPLRAVLINGSAELRAELECLGLADIELATRETKSIAKHAAAQAKAVLRGGEAPWIELRREGLAAGDPYRGLRGSLRMLSLAAAVFLITLTGVFFAKSWQFQNQLVRLNSQQAVSYSAAFPGARVPAALVARMKSEHAKLLGSHTAAEDVNIPVPALRVLLELLQALPSRERFVIRELRIEDGQIDLDVHLRQHASVNQVVQSLEARGFSVSAPATARQDDTSVSCRIFGALQLAAVPHQEGEP